MNKNLIIVSLICVFVGSFILVSAVSFGETIGDYGYKQLWNFSGGDLVTDNILLNGDLNVTNNIILNSGSKLWSNNTCTFFSSPDGSNVLQVCNT